MGSGSVRSSERLFCNCPEHDGKRETLAKVYPREGIEVVGRHHGTNHIGSMSVPDLLRTLAGTVDGSAIVAFVRQQVST